MPTRCWRTWPNAGQIPPVNDPPFPRLSSTPSVEGLAHSELADEG